MKKILIICLLMFCTTLPSFSEQWVKLNDRLFVDVDSFGQYIDDNGRMYLDKHVCTYKLVKDNGSKKTTENLYDKTVKYCVIKKVINVKNKKSATRRYIVYGKKGEKLVDEVIRDSSLKWEKIDSNTADELMYKEIIKGKKMYFEKSARK